MPRLPQRKIPTPEERERLIDLAAAFDRLSHKAFNPCNPDSALILKADPDALENLLDTCLKHGTTPADAMQEVNMAIFRYDMDAV